MIAKISNRLHKFLTRKIIPHNLIFMLRTSAPLMAYVHFLYSKLDGVTLHRFREAKYAFRNEIKPMSFSNDWFTGNLPRWLYTFEKYELPNKDINALEIGSWEGLSSYFILSRLPNAHLTCIDTWKGGDENKARDKHIISRTEENFNKNTAKFSDRVQKFKGYSYHFFAQDNENKKFDLIYIDGSHFCNDVVIDAIKSFELLKVGGIMIFDDYLWRYYKRQRDNPAAAINAFLQMKKGQYKIVRSYYQLIIRKVDDSDRNNAGF